MTILQSVNVRAATENDLRAIAEFKIDSPHLVDHSHPIDRAMQEVFIREFKKRWMKRLQSGMRTLILTHDEAILGFISYSAYANDLNHALITAEIHHIYVAPNKRRQRLGFLLCQKALDEMRESHIVHTTVWIPVCSHESEKFYEYSGFSRTSNVRIDKIRENEIREVQYRIDLQFS